MTRYIYLFIFFAVFSVSFAQQSQEELEQRKAKLQAEIQEKERMLQDIKSKELSVAKILQLQKEKIALKQKLIQMSEKQSTGLKNDMYINQVQINHLNSDLADLKKDYAEMIVKSYKSRSTQSRAMFLLSSESFTQAYKRLQYMKQYSSYRKMQADEIKDKSTKLVQYNTRLEVQKKQKQQLINEQEKQKKDLEKEKQEQEKIANSLKKDKKTVEAEIKKKQQEAKKIDAQINKLIKEAIAATNKKAAAAKAKANPKTTTAETKKITESTKIVLTPEAQLVSDKFKANKGRLPWPVEKGTITLGYGDQPHPIYSNLVVHNSGVDITTESGASARAVFNGEVTKVFQTSPLNKAVCIQHGDYFTVYMNLSSVSVSVGDKVTTKATIGKVRSNSDGKAVLKFMISQNTTYTNPSSWLVK